MKKILHILRRGAAYTTGILAVLYLFSFILPMDAPVIGAKNFFLILGFAEVLSLSLELFSIRALKPVLKYGIHYVTLTASFILLYLLSGNYAERGGSSLFVAIVLFTVGYAAVAVPCALIKGRYKKKCAESKPSAYKSIYR